jgi:hypothetical protein
MMSSLRVLWVEPVVDQKLSPLMIPNQRVTPFMTDYSFPWPPIILLPVGSR